MRLVLRSRSFPVGVVIAGSLAVAALLVRGIGLDRLPFPTCTFRALTGLPCMGCGSTRALGLLARLEPLAAFRMQPLATLAGAAASLWGLVDLALLPARRALRIECQPREALWLVWSAFGLALLNWGYLLFFQR
jgi:hypothetical protein